LSTGKAAVPAHHSLGVPKEYRGNRSIRKKVETGMAEVKRLKRRTTATDGRRLNHRRGGNSTRQSIGMLVANSAGMPFAPFYNHMGMPLQQAVELLPDVPVGIGLRRLRWLGVIRFQPLLRQIARYRRQPSMT
jgi:hypothetical protein